MILSFRTDRPGQTVQTQIRLHYSKEKPSCLTFRVITTNFLVSEILGFWWYSQNYPTLFEVPLTHKIGFSTQSHVCFYSRDIQDYLQTTYKLELVFMTQYAHNICLPLKTTCKWWIFVQSLLRNLMCREAMQRIFTEFFQKLTRSATPWTQSVNQISWP